MGSLDKKFGGIYLSNNVRVFREVDWKEVGSIDVDQKFRHIRYRMYNRFPDIDEK